MDRNYYGSLFCYARVASSDIGLAAVQATCEVHQKFSKSIAVAPTTANRAYEFILYTTANDFSPYYTHDSSGFGAAAVCVCW